MRGPGYKLTGDVRRTWRCSACGGERKLSGEITSLQCSCREGAWMQIVQERTMAPRPIQRPSDVERHPIDFGIEAPPPRPVRPEATIIKSAISRDPEPALESLPNPSQTETQADVQLTGAPQPNSVEKSVNLTNEQITNIEEDWGEGIL